MDPLKAAAQFAAFLWFRDKTPAASPSEQEALQFASDNWIAFLPAAREGVGDALFGLAAHRETVVRKRRALAACGAQAALDS